MKGEFWKDRNVLITGATGLLGSELTSNLLKQGSNVTVIIRDTSAKSRLFLENIYKRANIANGDVGDFNFVSRVISEYEVDTIFHLAAQTVVRIGNNSPLSTFDSNIKGTWSVLEAARIQQRHVRAIVVASSDKAYGSNKNLPYDENTPLKGLHPYDVSKSCADLIAQTYWNTYKLPVSITRCGNLFGPGDLNVSRIVPGTIISIMNGKRPVIRSSGKFIRNYFYAKDAVSGYLTLAQNIEKSQGEAFNLGTVNRFSVIEITNLILKLMKSKLKPVILDQASNEILDQYLDIGKIEQVFGWKAKYSINLALKETINWYEKYF